MIVALAFLFYYPKIFSVTKNKQPATQTTPTNVIKFTMPEMAPKAVGYPEQDGNCFASSVAEPYRQDAFRCMVENSIYDPCFSLTDASGQAQKGLVYCQVNPLKPDSFLIKLTKDLPKPEVPSTLQDNWAWFLTLKDGTQCSPFTGTRPFFGTGPDAQVAYYGCASKNVDEQVVLLGDLTKGNVWTAEEAILKTNGTNWAIISTQKVEIDTIWK